MGDKTIEELMSKLDYVLHSVWSIEEMILKYSGNVAKLSKDIEEIKSFLDLLNEKLSNIKDEIKGLR